jgi:diguanylate cyclase (GGDEF)-like protein
MVLAVNTDLKNSLQLAEHFRSAIENYDFEIGRKVTVSIGISTMKRDQTKEEIIKVADKALYTAKATGRNRICY